MAWALKNKMYKHFVFKTAYRHHSDIIAEPQLWCLPQMSSNSSLQVSHPLEKPSAACPAGFRRGWRETFKVIPHRPLNKPSIRPASQSSHLHTAPSLHGHKTGPLQERRRVFGLFLWSTTSFFVFPLSAKCHTYLLIDPHGRQSFGDGGKGSSKSG